MRLLSLDYKEFDGAPNQWTLSGLTLDSVNLLVGKNATGKTRTLNLIKTLAATLSGSAKGAPAEGRFEAKFEHNGQSYEYVLQSSAGKVTQESLHIDGVSRLDRGDGGAGKLFAEKVGEHGEYIDIQAPEDQVVAATRRDSIQHPFFEPLAQWADSVHHYPFGSELGRNVFITVVNDPALEVAPSPKDANWVDAVFLKGIQLFPGAFVDAVFSDMKSLGYPLQGIGVSPLPGDPPDPQASSQVCALFVQEADLAFRLIQTQISQGMFRALSILICVDYAVLASRPSCILIDDIGEGLDFDRSCSLIRVLVDRAKSSEIQLVMTTNDRFVMNTVPLENWSVIQRRGGDCNVRNYRNAQKEFDEFKFTGLNNFDFLALDYLGAEKASQG